MYSRSVRALQTIISTRSSHKAQSEYKLGGREADPPRGMVTNEREREKKVGTFQAQARAIALARQGTTDLSIRNETVTKRQISMRNVRFIVAMN